MAFQPFGFRFEIISPLAPYKSKAEIRARTKDWFDPKDGARGWIVGPFLCLWWSALDRHGPMLFGRISCNGFGTRISGRAGSDLNGLILFSLLVPGLAFLLWLMIAFGQTSGSQIAIIGGLVLLSPFVFWWSHKDRKEAEPLVRFVQSAITSLGQSVRSRAKSVAISPQVRITVSGDEKPGPVTAEAVHDVLLHAGVGDSVVVAKGAEDYIQTLYEAEGFIMEKREGDRLHHYEGVRRGDASERRKYFTFEEVLASLIAYGSASPLPDVVAWERMDLPA